MTRHQTPPALKLLLNERAAARGELAVATNGCARVSEEVAQAEAALETLRQQLAERQTARSRIKAVTDALELAIQSMYPGVDPDAAGVVHAWAGNYGRRGTFTAFVLAQIRQAAPRAVPTSEIAKAAIAQFRLTFDSAKERRQLASSVRNRIWEAAAAGLVERVPSPKAGSAGCWRWKSVSGRKLLAAAALANSHDEDSDSVRAEVGRQRAGRGHG